MESIGHRRRRVEVQYSDDKVRSESESRPAAKTMTHQNVRRRLRLCIILSCTSCVLLLYGYAAMVTNLTGMPLRSVPINSWRNIIGLAKGEAEWMTGKLKPHRQAIVPNIAHFIWFTCHEFRFDHLIPILSAFYVMKADRIMFHTDCEPDSRWWKEAKNIPVLEVIPRLRKTKIHNSTLNIDLPEHAADVVRLEILLEIGGVYLDTDVVVVNSLEPLRHYEFVIGQPAAHIFNNGMIVATKNSTFLKMFYDSYKSYDGDCFTCNSGQRPFQLSRQNPELVHVEQSSVVEWNHVNLFFGKYKWWENRYTIQVWIRAYFETWSDEKFTADNVRELDTSYGEIARYIYYGTKDFVTESNALSRMAANASISERKGFKV
ncbi:uncharacterized protein [Ptychodera flava]|uniref:uncharacterized protein isoform X1 n=2 Tax=Ptychodera flava TaxID=63121 RepID=UPI003969C2B9